MIRKAALLLLLVLTPGCMLFEAVMGAEVTSTDTNGMETTTTVGELAEENADAIGQTAGTAVTAVTGNPLAGLLAAGLASALAAGAAGLRKKKPPVYAGPGDIVPPPD